MVMVEFVAMEMGWGGGVKNDHNLCYLFHFGRVVKVRHRHLVQGSLLVVLQQHQISIWPPSEFSII